MTSTRPMPQQLVLDFSDEAESVTATSELRQEQSSSAAMEKSALDSVSMDLMEKIVDDGNMERAWKKVKANRGRAPTGRLVAVPMASPWTSSSRPSATSGPKCGGNFWKELINRVLPGESRFPNRMAA